MLPTGGDESDIPSHSEPISDIFGDPAGSISDIFGDPAELIPGQPEANSRLAALHARAQAGDAGAQRLIDAHLPLAAWCLDGAAQTVPASVLQGLVLSPADAPHVDCLPDLGRVIRDVWNPELPVWTLSHAARCVFDALVYSKVHKKLARPPRPWHCAPALNVLLALLLGLYPTCVKRPVFGLRARYYRAVHRLLTSGLDAQTAFCDAHPALLYLAFVEYCLHMLHAHMPAELAFFQGLDEVRPLLATARPWGDCFRQEAACTAFLPWDALEAAATPYFEKRTRLTKARHKRPKAERVRAQDPFVLCPELLQAHVIHGTGPAPRGDEDAGAATLLSEHALLSGAADASPLALQQLLTVHSRLSAHFLPENIKELQMAALRRHASSHFVLAQHTQMHLCLPCVLNLTFYPRRAVHVYARFRQQLRYCIETDTVICGFCNTSRHILTVNLLGKVLCIGTERYIISPATGRVSLYLGTGEDFADTAADTAVAAEPGGRRSTRVQTVPCDYCHARASHHFQLVDHLTGRMRAVALCYRHSPPDILARQACNAAQMYALVERNRKGGKG